MVSIAIPGEGKEENFIAMKVKRSDMSSGEILSKVKDYNGAPYAFGDPYAEEQKKKGNTPIDCFKFAVDLLNEVLLIHNDKQITAETGKDNDDRFNDLLPESFGTIKKSKK